MEQLQNKNGTKMEQTMEQKLNKNGAKVEHDWNKCGLKREQNETNMDQKLNKN